MSIGIYWIYQVSRDRAVYVGSSRNVEYRIRQHANALRRRDHPNVHLQRTWSKYGSDDFLIMPLETCAVEQLIEREEFWMNVMPAGPMCNNTRHGSAVFISDDARRKISESRKGKALSEETRRKLSETTKGRPSKNKGKRYSEQARRNISEAHKGKTLSEEARRKLSEALTGRAVSKETGQKISQAKKGKPSRLKGNKRSEEIGRKISASKMGHPVSDETRRKISEAHKRRHGNTDD